MRNVASDLPIFFLLIGNDSEWLRLQKNEQRVWTGGSRCVATESVWARVSVVTKAQMYVRLTESFCQSKHLNTSKSLSGLSHFVVLETAFIQIWQFMEYMQTAEIGSSPCGWKTNEIHKVSYLNSYELHA